MGVKGLWPILDPVGETCPLSELAGSSVAVDLSGWVVEAETAQSLAGAVQRPYLRNLVYRTSALLLQHTLPVFVLDGAAPQLKLAEMARRQGRAEASGGRQQLRGHLRRCAALLDTLGVPHLTSDGEAEALCARLDAEGRVDGVVSDDVDAALFGARTLYRHLTAGGKGGQVTRYSLRRVRQELNLDTQRLRELALLLGCDFLPAGLPGLGPQLAQQLVRRLDGRPLLPELGSWLRDPPLSDMRAVGELGRAPSHCVRCGHPGTERRHQRDSCSLCGVGPGCIAVPEDPAAAVCPCDWHRQRRDAEEHAAELKARDCARRAPEFETRAAEAEKELMRAAPLPDGDLTWKQPDIDRFTALAWNELGWPSDQCWKFAAPLLTRWQLRHGAVGSTRPLQPLEVVRTSRHHHVDCYRVRWRRHDGGEEVTTDEPRPLMEAAHRQLVDDYLDSKKKPKKTRQPRKPRAAGDAAKAMATVGSPSRLITDFFPTRKKAAREAVSGAVVQGKTGPPPAATAASGQTTQNPDPRASLRARAARCARHEISSESSADSPASRCHPATDTGSRTGDSHAAGESDALDDSHASGDSESYEGLDSDGSVADLSAIIDAITRTHIANDAVIVISDDDDDDDDDSDSGDSDVIEVYEDELKVLKPIPDTVETKVVNETAERAVLGKELLSYTHERTAFSAIGLRGASAECSAVDVPATVGCEDDGVSSGCDGDRGEPSDCAEAAVRDGGAGTVSDSDSDGDYVPLCRRLALKQ